MKLPTRRSCSTNVIVQVTIHRVSLQRRTDVDRNVICCQNQQKTICQWNKPLPTLGYPLLLSIQRQFQFNILHGDWRRLFMSHIALHWTENHLMNNQVERRMWMEFGVPPIRCSPYVGRPNVSRRSETNHQAKAVPIKIGSL